jgi:WD40 repeat protein
MVGVAMTALAWRASIARQTSEAAEERTRQVLYASTMRNVQTAVEQGDHLRAEQLLLGLRPEPDHADLRSFDWYYWWRQSHAGLVATIDFPPSGLVDSTIFNELRRVAAKSLPEDAGTQVSANATVFALNEPSDRTWLTADFLGDAQAHDGQVSDGMLSADESILASCGRDGTVQLWDAATRTHRMTLRAEPPCPFVRVDISPQCTLVAAATARYLPDNDAWDSEIYVWDVKTRQLVRRSDVPGVECKDLAFSPDGNELAVVGGPAVVINLESGEQRVLAAPGRQVTDCDYSRDGRQLVGISTGDNNLWLWDLDTAKIARTLSPHLFVSVVRFYPTAHHVVSIGDGELKLWNTRDAASAPQLTEPQALRRLAFSADGKSLITQTSYRWINVWDLPGAKRIHSFWPEFRHMSFSRESNVFAASLGNDVVLQSVLSGKRLYTLRGHTRTIRECHLADSGALLASGDGNPEGQAGTADAILWDAKSGRLLHRMPGHYREVKSLAVAPNDRTFATVDGALVLRIWDVATGRLMVETTPSGDWAAWGVGRLMFCRHGTSLYASSAGFAVEINPTTGTVRRKLAVGALAIGDLCVSPDNRTLAVARGKWEETTPDEGVVELWDLASGELKSTLGKEHGSAICVAFSPDGRTLASGHRNGKIALWQAATDDDVRRQAPY